MVHVFCSPLRYVQGPAATARLGAEMRSVGLEGPCLLVAGSTAVARLAPIWAETLDESGFVSRVRLFGGESSRREIAAIVEEARSLGCRTIVAAGGGKVLDAARSAAAQLGLHFVSCPTVCSTDAPTSALSVIYHDSGPQRGAVETYQIHRRSPDLVLVDTQVIAESPPRLLAAGIGDALSTWYEARAAAAADKPNMRGGRATLAAMALARLCRDTVLADGEAALAACRERRSTPALERIVEATTLLSGLGFESAGLAAAHAVHNGLTAVPETHGMWHGEKVAFGTLVHLMLEADAAGGEDQPEAAAVEARLLAAFCVRIGLPVTLAQLGLPDDDGGPPPAAVRRIAARATAAGETIHNMPFPVDADRVASAIGAADAVGRAALGSGRPAD